MAALQQAVREITKFWSAQVVVAASQKSNYVGRRKLFAATLSISAAQYLLQQQSEAVAQGVREIDPVETVELGKTGTNRLPPTSLLYKCELHELWDNSCRTARLRRWHR